MHANEIQRRGLARVDEAVSLLYEGGQEATKQPLLPAYHPVTYPHSFFVLTLYSPLIPTFYSTLTHLLQMHMIAYF